MEKAAKALNKAESLIEFLEVKDCGSSGGHDEDSPVLNETMFLLYDRFLALVRKYDSQSAILSCCGFDLADIQKYFKSISQLRSSIKETD